MVQVLGHQVPEAICPCQLGQLVTSCVEPSRRRQQKKTETHLLLTARSPAKAACIDAR